MFTLNHRTETFFLVAICIAAGTFLAFYTRFKPASNTTSNMPVIQAQKTEDTGLFILPTPTEAPAVELSSAEQISSDGSKKLILTKETNPDKTSVFTLTSQDSTGENSRVIFTKKLPAGSGITIPFNTWDPQNKYFFIREYSPEKTEIKVYTALGEPFANDELFLDLTGTFKLRNTGYNFQEATGWGGYSLIVFNTTNQANEQGSSFWFEVPNKAVIQLSTLFL